MIRIEPETSANPLFTNEQFLTISQIITFNPAGHYDVVESRFKQDSITHTRVHLWAWPDRRDETPARWWIEPDGHISLVEDCDWLTPEEWPAWAATEQDTL